MVAAENRDCPLPAKVLAVVPHVDGQGLAELARTVRQALIGHVTPPSSHLRDASQWQKGADQHASRYAFFLCHDVETAVLTSAVDVGMAGGTEQNLGASGTTAVGMGGGIVGREVGLGFDDSAPRVAVRERRPQQTRRNEPRVASVERPVNRLPISAHRGA